MSIINQMLKDLEKRKQDGNEDNNNLNPLNGASLTATPTKHPHRLKGLVILLILVVIAAITIYYTHQKNRHSAKQILSTSQNSSINTEAIIEHITKEKTHELTQAVSSYEVTKTHQIETIALSFSTPPRYNIDKDYEHKKAVITFLDTQNVASDAISNDSLIVAHQIETNSKNTDLILFFSNNLTQVALSYKDNNVIITVKTPIATETANEAIEDEEDIEEIDIQISPEQQQEIYYEEALANAKEGHTADAETMLLDMLNNNPDFHRARQSLALLILQKHHYQEALALLDSGLQLNPKNPAFIQLKARAQLQLDQPQAALDTLHLISPQLTDAPNYYSLMAAIEQRLGHYLYAAELYHQLLTAFPNNGVWWIGLAMSLENANQNNAALEAYQRAVNTKTLKPSIMAFAKSKINSLGG